MCRVFENSNQVVCIGTGLPLSNKYKYNLLHSEEIHTAITATQLIAGMNNTSVIKGNIILSLLPKKIDGPLGKMAGAKAWGIRGVEGWSLFRMLIWMVLMNFICFALVFCSGDMKTSFAPIMPLATLWYLKIGLVQYVAL